MTVLADPAQSADSGSPVSDQLSPSNVAIRKVLNGV
ncbi:hypothetical protein ACVWY2_009804 [Bradyrhizobium sp. JR6.1]